MNYLAHLYFAGEEKESILGNFLGDFIKGQLDQYNFSAATQAGIKLHRKIDKLTDNNIIHLLNTKQVDFKYRRYAGITFDLACDHFLALHWQKFHNNDIEFFAKHRINTLNEQKIHLPEHGKKVLARMHEYQWLENYQHLEFIEQVFHGIHKRFPRENFIHAAFQDLENNYLLLEESCITFMQQLQNNLLSSDAIINQTQ